MRKLFRLIYFLVITCFSDVSLAAEITATQHRFFDRPIIQIEGKIEKGDFEKFIDAALVAGGLTYEVYIASPGGDAAEAMRIGKLIRALKFQSTVPVRGLKNKPLCGFYTLTNEANCTCKSACVLIYLSGIYRSGDFLGVHRTFIDHEYLKDFSLEEASTISNRISELVRTYQLEMGAPASLNDIIESAPSDEIEILDSEYTKKFLHGYEKNTREWLIAKCGSKAGLNEASMTEGQIGDEAEEKFEEITECEEKSVVYERMKSFYPAIKSAINDSDSNFISRRSLLSDLKEQLPFDFSNLLGKQNYAAIDLLATVGGGNSYSDSELRALKGNTYFFPFWVIVFDEKGRVNKITIQFNYSKWTEEIETFPYWGHFTEGLSASSSLKDFRSKYGEPRKRTCSGSQRCEYRFRLSKGYIEARFDSKGKLRSVSWSLDS